MKSSCCWILRCYDYRPNECILSAHKEGPRHVNSSQPCMYTRRRVESGTDMLLGMQRPTRVSASRVNDIKFISCSITDMVQYKKMFLISCNPLYSTTTRSAVCIQSAIWERYYYYLSFTSVYLDLSRDSSTVRTTGHSTIQPQNDSSLYALHSACIFLRTARESHDSKPLQFLYLDGMQCSQEQQRLKPHIVFVLPSTAVAPRDASSCRVQQTVVRVFKGSVHANEHAMCFAVREYY